MQIFKTIHLVVRKQRVATSGRNGSHDDIEANYSRESQNQNNNDTNSRGMRLCTLTGIIDHSTVQSGYISGWTIAMLRIH